jgi:tetratricopeptide (TPR) repeat protein
MPSKPIGTVQHAAQVDHTISRIPANVSAPVVSDDASLVPFPGSTAGDRELGLAYASEALPQNNRVWGMRALELLKKTNSDDSMVAVQLAQLYDRMRQEQEACGLFAQAVNQGAQSPGALVNLGTCQAKQGDLDSAIRSWTQALQRNPGLEAARLNLAVAQIQSGRTESARANLKTGLKYDPFSPRLRELLRSITQK